MREYPTERWEQLGLALTARRIQLGYRTRAPFLRIAGSLSQPTIGDLERGRRSNYDIETIICAEMQYQLARGAIEEFLASDTTVLRTQQKGVARWELAPAGLPDDLAADIRRTAMRMMELAEGLTERRAAG